MSAAPSATLAEWETITIPTLGTGLASDHITHGRDHQTGRARARVHVADRALAEEGRASAYRLHRSRRGSRVEGAASQPVRQRGTAGGKLGLHGRQHVKHRLLTDLRLAARLDRLDRVAESARDL